MKKLTDGRRRPSDGNELKDDEKGNNSQTGNQIYFKIAGHVDLDKLVISFRQISDINNGF